MNYSKETMRLRLILTIVFATRLLLADVIDQVTLNTAPLIGNSSGPFTLDFQLVEGNGIGDSNNTVTLSDFSFGGGSVTTPPSSSTGGVKVASSPFIITLKETSFYDDVEFLFTPEGTLSFEVDATTNIDTVAPDTFTFALFNNSLSPIPTTNPNGFDSFWELDLPTTGGGTQTISSGTDTTQTSINIAAPAVMPQVSTVPEPSSFVLLATAMLAGIFLQRRHLLEKNN